MDTPPLTDAYSFSSLPSLSMEQPKNLPEQLYLRTGPPTTARERKVAKTEPVTSPFKTIRRISSFTIPRSKPPPKPVLAGTHGTNNCPAIPTPDNYRKRSLPLDARGLARDGQLGYSGLGLTEKKSRLAGSVEFHLTSVVEDNSHVLDQNLNITHVSMNKILPQRPSTVTPTGPSTNTSPIIISSQTPSPECKRPKSLSTLNGLRFTLMDAFKRIQSSYKPVIKQTPLNPRTVTITGSPRMICSRGSLVIGSSENFLRVTPSKKPLLPERQPTPQFGVSRFRVGRQLDRPHGARHRSSAVPFSCTKCQKKYKTSRGYKNHRCSRKTEDMVDCVCGRDRSDIGTMIFCDMCRNWLHLKCLGITEDNLPEQYFCPKCATAAHGKSITRAPGASKKPSTMSALAPYLLPSDLTTEDPHDLYQNTLQPTHGDLATDPFDSDGELPAFDDTDGVDLSSGTGQYPSLLFENDDDMYMLFSDVPPYDGTDALSSEVNGFVSEPCLDYDDTYRQFASKPQTVYDQVSQSNSMYSLSSMAAEFMSDPFSDIPQSDDPLSSHQMFETPAIASAPNFSIPHSEDPQTLFDFNSEDPNQLFSFTDSCTDFSMLPSAISETLEWPADPFNMESVFGDVIDADYVS
ncbi:hypothetical protein K493DRAFT_407697 [Basidiobolus meristosporus CBS 931.73]|uniref:PHD-type domain-containing protein n=1 Tax=Basidiobolus meristosporus CBS 931.73 TaxID=1314790 RepID=A0A1Y1YAW9_9FUNG|nr:hypothetical protein K493DRAFT_407697 [Basidiobolus meristosporus CBS 931.73]|eukprot:ORX95181.1 hypothetical protein K493DRAFT_407697 [Basidiobolus meristosporus CBS 931.73]